MGSPVFVIYSKKKRIQNNRRWKIRFTQIKFKPKPPTKDQSLNMQDGQIH